MKETFGEFIKKKRTEKLIRLNAFAHMVGISAVYASYLENGKRPAPSDKILKAMIEQLGLDASEAEKLTLLAAETHHRPTLPSDIIKYINENECVYLALRTAIDNNVSENTWLEFMDQVINPH